MISLITFHFLIKKLVTKVGEEIVEDIRSIGNDIKVIKEDSFRVPKELPRINKVVNTYLVTVTLRTSRTGTS